MGPIGMSAILNGFLNGVQKQKDLDFQNSEREHMKARRAVTEGREDTAYQQGQDDRAHNIERRGVLEGREDTSYGQQQEAYQHGLERRPVEEGQRDQMFGLNVAKTQQDMTIAKNRDARESAESGVRQRMAKIQTELAQMGLDDAKIAQGYKNAEKQLMPLFQQYQVTRDPTVFQDWYNTHVRDGNEVQIAQNPDGTWKVKSARGPEHTFDSPDDIARLARTLIRPDIYMESLYAHAKAQQEAEAARAKNPRNFVEPVQGQDGTVGFADLSTGQVKTATDADGKPFAGIVKGAGAGNRPAMLQEVDALLQNLPQQPGETSTQRWMRAYATANQRSQTSPEQSARGFYQATLTKLLPDAQYGSVTPDKLAKAQAAAQQLTEQFSQKYLGAGAPAPSSDAAAAPARSQSAIPAQAADYLRKNPALRSAFDAKYGAGSAAAVLGE
jgi:hypothetical protein